MNREVVITGENKLLSDDLNKHRMLELEYDIYCAEVTTSGCFRVDRRAIKYYPGRGSIGFDYGEQLLGEEREDVIKKRNNVHKEMIDLRVGFKDALGNLLKEENTHAGDRCLILLNMPRSGSLVANERFIDFQYGDKGDDYFVILKDGEITSATNSEAYYNLVEKYKEQGKLLNVRFEVEREGVDYPFNIYFYLGGCLDDE